MGKRTDEFMKYVTERNIMQKKYLSDGFSPEDDDAFETYLNWMVTCGRSPEAGELSNNKGGYAIPYIGDSYLLMVEDTMRETRYFAENGYKSYRYSSYDEVADRVYHNADYMERYMIGLQVSGYVWKNHRNIHRWYLEHFISKYHGEKYLEIGPGHGQYFTEAYNEGAFSDYKAVDLSESSLFVSKQYFEGHAIRKGEKTVEFMYGDFTKWENGEKYDAVCISEVLEHVEDPIGIMNKIYSILSDDGSVYVNVPINAPAIDHIYLFKSCEEVTNMYKMCGFFVVDSLIETGGGKTLERAVKKKTAINHVSILRKEIL